MSIPPMPIPPVPQQQSGRRVTEEGMALLYQELGRAIHDRCEARAEAMHYRQQLAEAAKLMPQPAAMPDAVGADLEAAAAEMDAAPVPIKRQKGG